MDDYKLRKSIKTEEKLQFFVNDEAHTVEINTIDPSTSLNQYLRDVIHLTGTKKMCLEGGCGACVVAVSYLDPVAQKDVIVAVNSCLIPVYSCRSWKIYTVEKIGNSRDGWHPVQKALVEFSGTQCGYCSPGMIMNMYALYETSDFTMKQVEDSFGGNICRCTGYRPILTGFKSLATDASQEVLGTYCDIEDLRVCKKNENFCDKKCNLNFNEAVVYKIGNVKWYKALYENEILDIISNCKDCKYMLVGGNTASGLYKQKDIKAYIDVSNVKKLVHHSIENNELILGANMTLSNTITLLKSLLEDVRFPYFKKLIEHLELVANVPVRNVGTLAGNLFTKHEHPEFSSDVFLTLETIGATVTIVGTDKKETNKSLLEFLGIDMNGKIIRTIHLPTLDSSYKFETYKIMPRSQNALALLNAGFLFKLNEKHVVLTARVVFGAINPNFVHAFVTEKFLLDRNLFDNDTLQEAFKTLYNELLPSEYLPQSTPDFRKKLGVSLFYKYILSIAPDDLISPRNKSGGVKQARSVSRGTQDFETNESLYPLTEPIPKVEAMAQCNGTAEYIMDMPDRPDQLYAAFVLAQAPANSTITKIDASKALKVKGVEAFYDHKDIPGENNFTPTEGGVDYTTQEELFCSGKILYYYQPVGIVVATSQKIAEDAAELVEVSYNLSDKKPILTIKDILSKNEVDKLNKEEEFKAKSRGNDVKHIINGTLDISFQYHYYMETQCCLVVPVEDGLNVYPSTQDILLTNGACAKVLNIPINRINISVRRIGGAYGGKISRNCIVSCAAALAAFKLKKPVKFSLPFTTNMNVIGKRHPLYSTYEVGLDDSGIIQYLETSLYSDMGAGGGNENPTHYIPDPLLKTYRTDTWDVSLYTTLTDTQTSTWTRGPGNVEGISYLGNLMQHIATELNLDVVDVHINNLDPKNKPMEKYLKELVEWAEVKERRMKINEFNQNNRWVKRGMAVVPMHFPTIAFGDWNALVSIHQGDGSVSVSHGGVEMGQGINTKVAQVTAHALGIPLNQVSIKPTNNLVSPNPGFTGSSLTSEGVCYAALKSIEILKKRMKPIQDKMDNPTWKELVRQCYEDHVDLTASFMFKQDLPDVNTYSIYGASCVEIELDVLTGYSLVTRVDVIEDVGSSISPIIDIGQVEGAFVMGMGYWTSEEIIFDEEGKLLTNTTWTYKPPGAKDIPIDFRIKFPKNNRNPFEILGSKAVAEPPLCMSIGLAFAIRDAAVNARIEADETAKRWYPIDGPSTVEHTFMKCLHDFKQYTL